jgi:hypothetical protein
VVPIEEARPGRRLPHDLEAEASTLGAIMLLRSAVEIAEARLSPADFYHPVNARIYAAALALRETGAFINPTTVYAWLTQHDPNPPIRRELLGRIQAESSASAGVETYALIVAETAARRRLIAASGLIADLGYSGEGTAADALERAQEALSTAEVPLGGRPAVTAGEFLSRTFEYRWVWPNHLAETERLLVVAPEKFGKSVLIRQVATCLSQGLDPFRGTAIPPALTLLIDLENPEALVQQKLDRLLHSLNTLDRPVNVERMRVESRPAGLNMASRSDRTWLLDLIASSRQAWDSSGYAGLPLLVCIGPIYKMLWDELNLLEVRRLQDALDQIRTRFSCALIMETHAPHESFGAKAAPRSLRPAGPRVWLRWPEFCRAIEPSTGAVAEAEQKQKGTNDLADFYDCQGARDERDWPRRLRRGGRLPWLSDEPEIF